MIDKVISTFLKCPWLNCPNLNCPFPRCPVHLFGPSGTAMSYDGVCVLPLNILHEKIFLALWFWYAVLAVATVASLVYWTVLYSSRRRRLDSSFFLKGFYEM